MNAVIANKHETDQLSREKDIKTLERVCDKFEKVARPDTIAKLKGEIKKSKEDVLQIDRFADESPSTK